MVSNGTPFLLEEMLPILRRRPYSQPLKGELADSTKPPLLRVWTQSPARECGSLRGVMSHDKQDWVIAGSLVAISVSAAIIYLLLVGDEEVAFFASQGGFRPFP